LTWRYVELKIYPFSFKEYISAFKDQTRLDLLFEDYLLYWGFPEAVNFLVNNQKTAIIDYLTGIYNTILNKDIITRFNITDLVTFNNVSKYLLDNIWNIVSPQKIADYLTENNDKTSYNTINKYLFALKSGLIFYEVDRKDLKWKQILQTLKKYYVVDVGFRRVILGSAKNTDLWHLLENIVYFELLRRWNIVYVWKQREKEVDFIARNPKTDEIVYYQVAYTIADEETLKRELAPFKSIKDNHMKILLTNDIHEANYDGIKQINIINWLLSY
jgi:predicted AAA+ superfamily ATPase